MGSVAASVLLGAAIDMETRRQRTSSVGPHGTRCPRAGSALPCYVSWVCSFSRCLHTQLEKVYSMISKTPSDAPESGN